jgi:hypothetical protein
MKSPIKVLQRVGTTGRWRQIQRNEPPTILDGNMSPIPRLFSSRWWSHRFSDFKAKLSSAILPERHQLSVQSYYYPFVAWNFVQMTLGAAAGVLATQSVLYGLGLSSHTQGLVLSGTLNWIIKDGLGQFGGIWIVSWLGGRFDIDAKRYRLLAAILLKVSCIIEVLVPLIPRYFILTAGIANVLKNVAWMASSATRAQIHKHLARRDNLGDITAKAASQNTLAGLVGTALGILISTAVTASGTELSCSPGASVLRCLYVVVPLSCLSLVAAYRSCQYAVSPRLNLNRIETICINIFRELLDLSSPSLRPDILATLSRYTVTPEIISRREPIIFNRLNNNELSQIPLEFEPPMPPTMVDLLDPQQPYWIVYSDNTVRIWIQDYIGDKDETPILLKAILQANILRYYISQQLSISIEVSAALAEQLIEPFKNALLYRGWNLDELVLGPRHSIRIRPQADDHLQ